MKAIFFPFLIASLSLGANLLPLPSHAEMPERNGQIVIPAGSQASTPAGKTFTGQVRLDPAFRSQAPARVFGVYVTFEPGARTDWHTHSMGQTLIVTFGKGLTQEWGGPIRVIRQGDIVSCPPGVKHWHGAAPDTAMTHLAISESGGTVTWMEKVDDKVYQAPAQEETK